MSIPRQWLMTLHYIQRSHSSWATQLTITATQTRWEPLVNIEGSLVVVGSGSRCGQLYTNIYASDHLYQMLFEYTSAPRQKLRYHSDLLLHRLVVNSTFLLRESLRLILCYFMSIMAVPSLECWAQTEVAYGVAIALEQPVCVYRCRGLCSRDHSIPG